MCERDWNEIMSRKNRIAHKTESGKISNLADYNDTNDNQEMFWIKANKAECHFGLGEMEEYQTALEAAKKIEHAEWMMKAFENQQSKLLVLMTKYGHLLNPPWKKVS
jgi:hypothetical protein